MYRKDYILTLCLTRESKQSYDYNSILFDKEGHHNEY